MLNREICPSKLNVRNYVIQDYVSESMYIWEFTMHVAKRRRKKRILGI
jgi:hypothetical protein